MLFFPVSYLIKPVTLMKVLWPASSHHPLRQNRVVPPMSDPVKWFLFFESGYLFLMSFCCAFV